LAEFRADRLPLTAATWMLLRGSLIHSRNELTNAHSINQSISISKFLNAPTKGSKRFRRVLDVNSQLNMDLVGSRAVNTFCNLIGVAAQDPGTVRKCWSSWDRSGLGNNLREFLFKFRNNYLALNNRVNAFDPDVDPRCTFCRIQKPQHANHSNIFFMNAQSLLISFCWYGIYILILHVVRTTNC
jgi:hypothetical protein